MTVIKILVNGALGKMGRLAVQSLKAQADFNVVAECGRADNLAEQLKQHRPDVVLDLTLAAVAATNLAMIIEHGIRPVIGTSGLSQAMLEPYQQRCRETRLGGLIVPNFSMAAICMMRFATQAAQYFDSVEIIEAHHPAKHDAPSGTAIKTVDMLQAQGKFQSVPVHSVRMHGVLAKQQVLLGNPGDLLTLEANTSDRQAYMPGVLFACRRVIGLSELVYGLDRVLFKETLSLVDL